MFSKRLWKFLGFRLLVMEWGHSAPVKWDHKSKRLCSPSNYSYWNFGMYQFYVSFAACYISSKLAIKHTLSFSKIFEDVEDEVEEIPNPLESVLTTLDITFVAIFIVVAGVQHLFRKWKLEIIAFFNELVEIDEAMEDIFKLQIYSHPTYKRTVAVVESLILLTCVVSLFLPIIFGIFFLQPTEPCHRVVVEILEIHPGLNLQTLPLIVMITWSVLQCSNTVVLMIMIGFLYLKFYSFWITSLQPISIIQDASSRKYLTQLGYIKAVDMVRLYRIHQVLNRMCNQVFANRIIACHQAVIQIVMVASTSMCIRHLELILFTPGYQIGFIAIATTVLLEYLETKMVAHAAQSSYLLRRKLRSMTARNDLTVKAIGNTWDLRAQLAYPYFKLGRHTFLEFMQSSIAFIMDCLLALE